MRHETYDQHAASRIPFNKKGFKHEGFLAARQFENQTDSSLLPSTELLQIAHSLGSSQVPYLRTLAGEAHLQATWQNDSLSGSKQLLRAGRQLLANLESHSYLDDALRSAIMLTCAPLFLGHRLAGNTVALGTLATNTSTALLQLGKSINTLLAESVNENETGQLKGFLAEVIALEASLDPEIVNQGVLALPALAWQDKSRYDEYGRKTGIDIAFYEVESQEFLFGLQVKNKTFGGMRYAEHVLKASGLFIQEDYRRWGRQEGFGERKGIHQLVHYDTDNSLIKAALKDQIQKRIRRTHPELYIDLREFFTKPETHNSTTTA